MTAVGDVAAVAQRPVTEAGLTSSGSSSAVPDVPEAQGSAVEQTGAAQPVDLSGTPRRIVRDQREIWTSPARMSRADLVWFLPAGAAVGAAIATDHHAMDSVVTHDPDLNQANVNASNVLIGGFIAAPVALYGYGHWKESPHARQAGILGGEALLDGLVVEQGMKLIFWRERPAKNRANGLFFQGDAGVDSSFPSSHSVLAWSEAAVLAGEYPSWANQLAVYSLATGVSLTRVIGKQHFPSDVLAGSTVGWLVGHYVFAAHRRHRVGSALRQSP